MNVYDNVNEHPITSNQVDPNHPRPPPARPVALLDSALPTGPVQTWVQACV